jgi:hypothetical protein
MPAMVTVWRYGHLAYHVKRLKKDQFSDRSKKPRQQTARADSSEAGCHRRRHGRRSHSTRTKRQLWEQVENVLPIKTVAR